MLSIARSLLRGSYRNAKIVSTSPLRTATCEMTELTSRATAGNLRGSTRGRAVLLLTLGRAVACYSGERRQQKARERVRGRGGSGKRVNVARLLKCRRVLTLLLLSVGCSCVQERWERVQKGRVSPGCDSS